jgi:hypothetical protein
MSLRSTHRADLTAWPQNFVKVANSLAGMTPSELIDYDMTRSAQLPIAEAWLN